MTEQEAEKRLRDAGFEPIAGGLWVKGEWLSRIVNEGLIGGVSIVGWKADKDSIESEL